MNLFLCYVLTAVGTVAPLTAAVTTSTQLINAPIAQSQAVKHLVIAATLVFTGICCTLALIMFVDSPMAYWAWLTAIATIVCGVASAAIIADAVTHSRGQTNATVTPIDSARHTG